MLLALVVPLALFAAVFALSGIMLEVARRQLSAAADRVAAAEDDQRAVAGEMLEVREELAAEQHRNQLRSRSTVSIIHEQRTLLTGVAVGLPAARAARRFATVPVVVGQVFNVHEGELLSDDVKAVAVLPPINKGLAGTDAVARWLARGRVARNDGAQELVRVALLLGNLTFKNILTRCQRDNFTPKGIQ